MRRATLELLRCPRCEAGSLVPGEPVAEPALIFGPVHCLGCQARYPVHEGLIDFVSERDRPSALQQAMETPWVARSWERYVRPAFDVFTHGKLDRESEYVVIRSMAGRPSGPVVDLGCGSGLFLRRLVKDFPDSNVIGVDVSRPMIEEAMAQVREHGVAADFVRALTPPLPFLDHTLGAIVATGLVHFVADLDPLMREVARVLTPRGHFVATSWSASAPVRRLQKTAGMFPRSEDLLRKAADRAGLIHFERMKADPFLVFSVELP